MGGSPAEGRNDGTGHAVADGGLAAQQVWTALRGVADPELDESIVDLGFVSAVVADGEVAVSFRLPTFWCSANFAWIMAEDIRLALMALPWLRRAGIRLDDHFAAEKINRGIALGLSFRESFGAETDGDLGALRATFRRKAYLGRMSAVIEALRARGLGDGEIVAMRLADLAAEREARLRAPIDRYLELRGFFGGPCGPGDDAFRTPEGRPIAAAGLAAFVRDIRMTRRSIEANAEMCRILLVERYRTA
jgi:metal-sulfur cluster biosynthetic enzyme